MKKTRKKQTKEDPKIVVADSIQLYSDKIKAQKRTDAVLSLLSNSLLNAITNWKLSVMVFADAKVTVPDPMKCVVIVNDAKTEYVADVIIDTRACNYPEKTFKSKYLVTMYGEDAKPTAGVEVIEAFDTVIKNEGRVFFKYYKTQ